MGVFAEVTGSKSLKELVYLKIKEAIIKGELRPDESLVEVEIARDMNISRAPIREALNKLEKDGFVVNTPRKGCKVSKITKQGISEIFEARLLMEPFAIRKTIHKIPQEDILQVEKKTSVSLANPTEFELFIEADKALHALFHKYLSNEYIKNMMEHVENYSMRMRYSESYEELKPKDVIIISSEHQRIIEALKSRDIDEAIIAISNHIVQGEKRTLKPMVGNTEL